jgi:periplasmic protein CpxP/Spy
MKKTIILSMAMAFATFGAFAQESAAPGAATPQGQMKPRGTVEERAKVQADRINATAQLSTDQYAKVLELTKSSITQREAIRASGAQGDDMKAKMKDLRTQDEAKLKAILTPEQYEKVQTARKEAQGHRGE